MNTQNYMNEMFGLSGRVAALTGAGGFLVGEMSRGLAKAGAKVAVLDANLDHAEKVAGEIRQAGGEAVAMKLDVVDKTAWQATLEDVVRTRTYLADPGAFEGYARAHGEAFSEVRPANTTVVAALLDPRWLVEIEVEAVKS